MRNMEKLVGLLAALLLVAGGIGLAADLPDLVPWAGGGKGGIGIKHIKCIYTFPYTQQYDYLSLMLGIRNIGTAKTTHAVKTLVKVDGAVWNSPHNPHTTPAEMWPGQHQEIPMSGPAPGPGTHTLWVKVDSENKETELDEYNNECTATITCGVESTATVTCGTLGRVGPPRRVESPILYPKPKVGPPPVEQPYLPPARSK